MVIRSLHYTDQSIVVTLFYKRYRFHQMPCSYYKLLLRPAHGVIYTNSFLEWRKIKLKCNLFYVICDFYSGWWVNWWRLLFMGWGNTISDDIAVKLAFIFLRKAKYDEGISVVKTGPIWPRFYMANEFTLLLTSSRANIRPLWRVSVGLGIGVPEVGAIATTVMVSFVAANINFRCTPWQLNITD